MYAHDSNNFFERGNLNYFHFLDLVTLNWRVMGQVFLVRGKNELEAFE